MNAHLHLQKVTVYLDGESSQEWSHVILETMATQPVLRPPAQQARSRRTEHSILQAALKTLSDLGEEGITMNSVSERAGVSVGSIYPRFGDREGLLVAMTNEFASEFSRTIGAKLEAAPADARKTPENIISYATTVLARNFEKNSKAFGRLLLMGLSDPLIFAEGQRASIEGGGLYSAFILQARSAICRPDPEAAVEYTYRLIYAMCSHRITQGGSLESRRSLGWSRLIAELVEMNVAYLLHKPLSK